MLFVATFTFQLALHVIAWSRGQAPRQFLILETLKLYIGLFNCTADKIR